MHSEQEYVTGMDVTALVAPSMSQLNSLAAAQLELVPSRHSLTSGFALLVAMKLRAVRSLPRLRPSQPRPTRAARFDSALPLVSCYERSPGVTVSSRAPSGTVGRVGGYSPCRLRYRLGHLVVVRRSDGGGCGA